MAEKDEIREAILERIRAKKLTAYRLSKESGVDTSAIRRYIIGESMLGSLSISRLCRVLRLELKAVTSPRRPLKHSVWSGK